MSLRLFFFLIPALLFFSVCDSTPGDAADLKQDTPIKEIPLSKINPSVFLQEPTNTILVETATEALPIWRKQSHIKPALILFSNDPFLEQIPKEIENQAMDLVHNGTEEQIKTRAVDITPTPLLLHDMAVNAALKAGFFSEIVWILPGKDGATLPTLERMKQNLLDNNLISQAEADTLTEKDNTFSGFFRDIPVTISILSSISRTANPAWLHFDLSFFQPIYKNEVSTPLYPLVFGVLEKIQAAEIKSVGASISLSNLGGPLSLRIRFLGKELAYLFGNPAALDADLPEIQKRRTQNLYLEQFMKREEVLENSLKLKNLAPEDASVKYELFNVYRTLNQGNLALEYLEQAVALDPLYAIEYFSLADTAVEKNRPDAALEMLAKVRKVFPENLLILLMEANVQVALGHKEQALFQIQQLKKVSWSEVYYKRVPSQLAELEAAAAAISQSHTQ